MKYVIAIVVTMAGVSPALAECYYTNGQTHCCWTHVNGKDKVCN